MSEAVRSVVRADGRNLGGGMLKVNNFLNHQLHPTLVKDMGACFAAAFKDLNADRILTAEVSGIAPALATGMELGLPVVYARKVKPATMVGGAYHAQAESRTKGGVVDLYISTEFLHAGERVLIIDDFLATGGTLGAIGSMAKSAGAVVVGMGAVCEKGYQGGRQKLADAGYSCKIVSLANIVQLAPEANGPFVVQ